MLALPSEDVSDALHDSLQALSLSKSGEAPLGESFAQVQCSLEVYGELIQERERAVEEGYESSSVLDPIRQDLESLKDALQAMVQRELKHRENTFKKIARVKDEIAQHCLWLGEDLAQHVNDSTVSSKSSLYRQLVDLEQIRGAVGEIVKERAALWLSLVAEIRAISSRLGYDTGEYVPAPGCYSLASLDGLRSKIGLLSQELHHKIQILATLFLALIDTAREADITIVDSVLSPLCQDLSAVLAMDSVGDRPVTAQEYIRSQGIALSDDFTSQVRAALETIQKQYGQKLEALNIVIREIHMFWDQMGAPVQNRMELPPLLSRYQEYRQLADYLRIEWKRQMEDQVNKLLERLQELWIKCHVNESERESFMNKIKENLYSPVTVEMLNEQIKILEQRYEQCHQLFVKIEKRTAFIEKIVDFEKRAQDKNRLFRPSFQLVEEEKFRKTCFPTLLNMESDLHRDVLAFESETGQSFLYNGARWLDTLNAEIQGRFINEGVFVFEYETERVSRTDSGALRTPGRRPSAMVLGSPAMAKTPSTSQTLQEKSISKAPSISNLRSDKLRPPTQAPRPPSASSSTSSLGRKTSAASLNVPEEDPSDGKSLRKIKSQVLGPIKNMISSAAGARVPSKSRLAVDTGRGTDSLSANNDGPSSPSASPQIKSRIPTTPLKRVGSISQLSGGTNSNTEGINKTPTSIRHASSSQTLPRSSPQIAPSRRPVGTAPSSPGYSSRRISQAESISGLRPDNQADSLRENPPAMAPPAFDSDGVPKTPTKMTRTRSITSLLDTRSAKRRLTLSEAGNDIKEAWSKWKTGTSSGAKESGTGSRWSRARMKSN